MKTWSDILRDYGAEGGRIPRGWYDEVAEAYRRYRPPYDPDFLEQVWVWADLRPGARVLEIGCGPGTVTLPLARRGLRIVALDPSAGACETARRLCAPFPEVRVEQSLWEDWVWDGESFDAILAATAWHWLSPQRRCALARRYLKPGGVLILLWNTPPQPEEDICARLDPVYQELAPELPAYARRASLAQHRRNLAFFEQELLNCGYFSQTVQADVLQDRDYVLADYLGLLGTLSPFIALTAPRRQTLLAALGETLRETGRETLPLSHLTALQIARLKLPER